MRISFLARADDTIILFDVGLNGHEKHPQAFDGAYQDALIGKEIVVKWRRGIPQTRKEP